MIRKTYYDPFLDKPKLSDAEYEYTDTTDRLQEPSDVNPANLISSLADDGKHYPALDVDIPCRYVPSSTPGHGHLYFDTLDLTWTRYKKLLIALGEAGILEPGYVEASIARSQSLLRPEGVKKGLTARLDPCEDDGDDF